jgi:hypothetical protein
MRDLKTKTGIILACIPVRFQAPTESTQGHCDICEEAVWVALSSPAGVTPRCMKCVVDMWESGDKFEPLTPRQIADIKSKTEN